MKSFSLCGSRVVREDNSDRAGNTFKFSPHAVSPPVRNLEHNMVDNEKTYLNLFNMNPYFRIPNVTSEITSLIPACNRWQVIRRGNRNWRDLGVDGWIILGWISRRWDVGIWTGLGRPRIETGGGRL